MASVLTQMIRGDIPAWCVAADAKHIAFLEQNPSAPGHLFCLPREEFPSLFEMPEVDYQALMAFTRQVAIALEKAVPCIKVGVSVIGLKTLHAHVHLIPLNTMDDIRFIQKIDTSGDYFPRTQQAIIAQLPNELKPAL